MFSAALEVVLTIAYREAVSRRHAYVTLEHLLYALAHDNDGERILAACGADLPQLRRDLDAYLERVASSSMKRGDAARARADGGVPPRAADRRAARAERAARRSRGRRHLRGHPAAAEDARRAAARRAGRDAARHPRVHLARHLEGAARRARRRAGEPGTDGRRRRRRIGDGARSARRLLLEPHRTRARRACSIR